MKIYNTLLIFFISIKLLSQVPQDSVPVHETFAIQSVNTGDLRTINVWLPLEYQNTDATFPVLYMPDGGVKEDFPHIANTLAQLIRENKIPPIILVGIENTQRRRDLTGPTQVEKDKEIAPIVGGAPQFRAFIEKELISEINKKYRTNAKKGIIGESLAGLFVTETLLLQPDLFDFYIAFDPSLWWNDKNLLNTSSVLLDQFPSTAKTFWFGGSSAKDIYKSTVKLSEILKAKNLSNLQWFYSPEPKEKHNTIFRATKEKALIWTLNR